MNSSLLQDYVRYNVLMITYERNTNLQGWIKNNMDFYSRESVIINLLNGMKIHSNIHQAFYCNYNKFLHDWLCEFVMAVILK